MLCEGNSKDVFILGDCRQAIVFSAEGGAPGGRFASSGTVANSIVMMVSDQAGDNVPGSPQAIVDQVLGPETKIWRYLAREYFVGYDPDSGDPALYMIEDWLSTEPGHAANRPVFDIVDNVYDMSFRVAFDFDGDGLADLRNAAIVRNTSITNWMEIMAVEVRLSLRSAEDNVGPVTTDYGSRAAQLPFDDDKRLKEEYAFNVVVRNRTQ